MNERVLYWPRGRVWGGSSALNAMAYVRGHPYDYDRWEKEGATNWSYKYDIFKFEPILGIVYPTLKKPNLMSFLRVLRILIVGMMAHCMLSKENVRTCCIKLLLKQENK